MKTILKHIPLHFPTLVLMLVVYGIAVGAMWARPQRFGTSGFHRMEAHQLYAKAGRAASLGLIDRTLVDWGMRGPTDEENARFYNGFVWRSTVILTPVFIAWFLGLAVAIGVFRSRKAQRKGTEFRAIPL